MSRFEELSKVIDQNPCISQALNVIHSTYGDSVSVGSKAKNLNKFGTNTTVGNDWETVAQFQGTVGNETFVSTNLIDSVVSTDAGDAQVLQIEGHTIDGSGLLTFVVQDVIVNGTTPVTLTTPLARATRAFVKPEGSFGSFPNAVAGTISVYDDTDGQSGGTPTTAAATKLIIEAGFTQSEKAATSISNNDYWLIHSLSASVGTAGGSANRVAVRMESRTVNDGGAWRPLGETIVLVVGQTSPPVIFKPLKIVPPNSDWRIVAKTNANTAEVFAGASGILAN